MLRLIFAVLIPAWIIVNITTHTPTLVISAVLLGMLHGFLECLSS